jgi:hypothetical protein
MLRAATIPVSTKKKRSVATLQKANAPVENYGTAPSACMRLLGKAAES